MFAAFLAAFLAITIGAVTQNSLAGVCQPIKPLFGPATTCPKAPAVSSWGPAIATRAR